MTDVQRPCLACSCVTANDYAFCPECLVIFMMADHLWKLEPAPEDFEEQP